MMSNHGFRNIGDPNATFGINDGNPLWEELRDIALKAARATGVRSRGARGGCSVLSHRVLRDRLGIHRSCCRP